MTPEQLREALEAIAKTADVPTLKMSYVDRSDFHDIPVWSLEKMLKAAFVLGMQTASTIVDFDSDLVTEIDKACDRAIS